LASTTRLSAAAICERDSADLGRCRYRGLAKTRVQNILIPTAVNLTRLDAWFAGKPLGRTRVSHLAALATT
jgi:hypothetical protein